MRIVSLVPGITEFLFAIGAGDFLVGRSHDCDHPVTATVLPPVTAAPGRPAHPLSALPLLGESPVPIDEERLAALRPDLVILGPGQSAPGWDTLPLRPPARIEDVLHELELVGDAVGAGAAGRAFVHGLRTRLARLELILAARPRPRTALIEWTSPLLAPGLWVPELVEAGGGHNVFGTPGAPAALADYSDIGLAQPVVVVLAFAGLNLHQTQVRLHAVMQDPQWLPATNSARVVAIDAAAYVSRPGPRLVEGAELIAWALHRPHPVMQPPPGRIAELIEAGWVDLAAVRSQREKPAERG